MADLAAAQHGVVACWQLYALGLSRYVVSRWSRGGRLVRLHPGVYAFGHAALTIKGRRMAWALAAGPDADLSDRTAAAAHGVFVDHGTRVHITTPRGATRGLPFFVTHQRRLHPEDRTRLDGIPVTSLERTLIDIAATEHPSRLERALERAEELNLLDLTKIEEALERNRGQRGVARVRAAIEFHQPKDPRKIRSRMESGMLRLLRQNGFPTPQVNLVIAGWEVDLHWDHPRVAVELDGWDGHRTNAAFERDHDRDLALRAHGYDVVRVSWKQFRTNRPAVLNALADALR